MIRSRTRPVVFPQLEHARLAGTIASLFGNAAFDPPPLPPLSFVAGVSLHDRGYGPLDAADLFAMPEAQWLAITRRGFEAVCSDLAADLVVKYHLRRLARKSALAAGMDATIQARLRDSGLSAEAFERADRVTDLCDRIALDFCQERPAEGKVAVHGKNGSADLVEVKYRIDGAEIRIDPWPLSVEGYSTFVIGYDSSAYPERLDPVVAPARLAPGGGPTAREDDT